MKNTFGMPFWWENQKPLSPKFGLPERVDLLVIGAGFTGLSAALTAAKMGAKICVVDAERIGFGASSRNGGMAGAHPRMSLEATAKKFGMETAKGLFNEAMPAFEHLRNLLSENKIDCDYQNSGRIQLAWTRADFESQCAMANDMNENTQFNVEIVERQDLPNHINTAQYFGGLFFEDHGSLHPRKFVDGLAKAVLKAGVPIVEHCRVDHVQRNFGGFVAETNLGIIRADKVILASNGYTVGKGFIRKMARRVFPLPSYLIATEKLGKDRLTELAPAMRMMVETRARHSYYRPTPDGSRILWGGRASIRQIPPEKAISRLRASMLQIWPSLEKVKITHAWKGNTGYSFRQAPEVGQLDGIHYAAGYCGGGVVLAPYLGMKAALQALGDQSGETAYSQTKLNTKFYYLGGKPWFLGIADQWYRYKVDPQQDNRAKIDHKETEFNENSTA